MTPVSPQFPAAKCCALLRPLLEKGEPLRYVNKQSYNPPAGCPGNRLDQDFQALAPRFPEQRPWVKLTKGHEDHNPPSKARMWGHNNGASELGVGGNR